MSKMINVFFLLHRVAGSFVSCLNNNIILRLKNEFEKQRYWKNVIEKNYMKIIIYLQLCWEKKYKTYYSVERYNIFYILEVKLGIINVHFNRQFVFLIASSAIDIVTICFSTNLLKAT